MPKNTNYPQPWDLGCKGLRLTFTASGFTDFVSGIRPRPPGAPHRLGLEWLCPRKLLPIVLRGLGFRVCFVASAAAFDPKAFASM